MKKLSLLFILCMVSMLAFAQSDSPVDSLGGGPKELASDNNPATCPGDDLSLTPQIWRFGEAALGFPSYGGFTLCNGRSNSVTIFSITASPKPPFSVFGTSCGGILVSGGSCTITVEFKPQSLGDFNGTLTVQCSAPGCPKSSTLTGSGKVDVTLTPSSASFAALVGYESSPQQFTLTSNEPVVLPITDVGVSYPFVVTSNSCGGSLPPNGHCDIGVAFHAYELGTVDGTLSVSDSAPVGSPQTSSLEGTGYCNPIHGCQ